MKTKTQDKKDIGANFYVFSLDDFYSFLNKNFRESMRWNSFIEVLVKMESEKIISIEEGKIILNDKRCFEH